MHSGGLATPILPLLRKTKRVSVLRGSRSWLDLSDLPQRPRRGEVCRRRIITLRYFLSAADVCLSLPPAAWRKELLSGLPDSSRPSAPFGRD
eukprot:529689-Pyramimonas_sp.AAC.1